MGSWVRTPSRSLKKRCKSKQIPDNLWLSGIFVLFPLSFSAEYSTYHRPIRWNKIPLEKGKMADSFEEYPELTEELKNGTLTTKAINDDPMLMVKELFQSPTRIFSGESTLLGL
jgi:hypothetical protein